MPDAQGNIKGISVPRLPASMEVRWEKGKTFEESVDRSELSVSDGGGKARENSQGAKPNPDCKAWEKARRQAHINASFRQAEQDR